MTDRATRTTAVIAVAAWALLAAYLITSHVLGTMYDPKTLQDQNPGITPQQWAEIMASPVQRAREAMIPVWRLSRYIIPVLAIIAVGFTWRWWRVRSNSRLLTDTSTSPLRAQRGAAKPER